MIRVALSLILILAPLCNLKAQGIPFLSNGMVHAAAGGAGTGSAVGTPQSVAGAEPVALPSYTIQGTTNNLLIVCEANPAGDTMGAPTDTKSNTWTQITTLVSGNGWGIHCFSAVPNATGSDTITCHGQFGDTVRCQLQEFSDTQAFVGNDTNNTGTAASGGNTTDAIVTSAFTTTVKDIIVGFGCNFSGTPTVGTGFTASVTVTFCMLEYKLNVAAGSQTATETSPASTAWLIQGFGLKL